MDGINRNSPTSSDSAGALNAAQQTAESEIVGEQLQTIDAKLRAKKNEGAYARASAFLSQNVS